MNVLALCAGIGGLERGVNMALGGRARTVCYVEREVYAACALLARMEDSSLDRAPVWDDLTTFDAGRWRGAVDLVTAGFPCQPWSVAGKRKGTADDRWIWPGIVRIIRDCGAPLVFLENVPGLLRHGLRAVLSDLAALGFDAEWTSVRASDVGAPHRRERVFVLAYHHEHGREVLRSAGLLDRERETCRGDADGRDQGVADAGSAEVFGEPWRIRRERPEGMEPEGAIPPEPGHASEGVGHAERSRESTGTPRGGPRDSARESGQRMGTGCEGHGLLGFPPGPGDAEGWRRWLAAGGPAPAISALRARADGFPVELAVRTDALRALGNACVPAQACAAFRELAGRVIA